MSVNSNIGKGSVFSFTLPLRKTKEMPGITDAKENNYDIKELSKLKVLIVENNPINIKHVSSLFKDYGIKADVAETGLQCVDKIKNNLYDVILMDIEMPEMNGYDATNIIRKELKNDIPIIAMTAHAMSGEKDKCLQFGMNEYISKPINPELLFEKMFNVTSYLKSLKEDSNEKIVDLSYLFNTVNNDKNMIGELIDIFLKQIPEDLTVINDAVKNSDYLKIKQVTHRMKSTVSVMGISVLVPVLQQLEKLGAEAKEMEEIKKLSIELHEKCNKAMKEVEAEKSKLLNSQAS